MSWIKTIALSLVALVAGTVSSGLLSGPAEAQSIGQGGVGAASLPREVDLSALPRINSAQIAVAPRKLARPLGLSDSAYAAVKAAAARGTGPSLVEPVGESPQPASSASGIESPGAVINFSGNGEIECGNVTPADQALAIGDGSNPIVQVTNACISIWSPSGTRLVGPIAMTTFFGLPSGTYMTDPRALYDWYNHRFIIIAINNTSANSFYNIAISKSDDPVHGGWYLNQLITQSCTFCFPDFPRLGQDRHGIYVAANIYTPLNQCPPIANTCVFQREEWLLLPKAQLYAGAAFSFWFQFGMSVGGTLTDTSQPINVWSPFDNPRAEFFVSSQDFTFSCPHNGLHVWAVSNPFGFISGGPSPEFSEFTVRTANNYCFPPSASQPGGANTIDTGDNRISGEATYGSGYIHAALAADNGSGGVQSIIYKIDPVLNTNDPRCTGSFLNLCPQITAATLENESILRYSGSSSAYYATPQPDLEGNVTIGFNFSNGSFFGSMAYISQRVTQAPGTFFDAGIFLKQGLAFYRQSRWGDYTAVAPAGVFYTTGATPATPGMGFAGMYADSSGNWATQIGFNSFTAPNQP